VARFAGIVYATLLPVRLNHHESLEGSPLANTKQVINLKLGEERTAEASFNLLTGDFINFSEVPRWSSLKEEVDFLHSRRAQPF